MKLVVLAGPNGSGKSSLFDAFRTWQGLHGGPPINNDPIYQAKVGAQQIAMLQYVDVAFHGDAPPDGRKAFSIRTAYRNEADFIVQSLNRLANVLDVQRITRLIDNDVSVSENYQRLVSLTVSSLFDESNDDLAVKTLREQLFGELQESFTNLFAEMRVPTLRDPLTLGTFTFEKGISRGFQYKNLSGGEKAAFDLVLDIIIKRTAYNDTVYCIDEPEVHLGTRLQGQLLRELIRLIPDSCQLWIATHSIGMLNAAKQIAASSPTSVAFLNFGDRDFDRTVEMQPESVTRQFWLRTLSVSLDDIAGLVAPARLVLCEGSPLGARAGRAEFDAKCLRTIFGKEFPDTDFVSVGNSLEVRQDKLGIGRSIATILPATQVIRLIDRDEMTSSEIESAKRSGLRVLSRRHIESFLLDDEIVGKFCEANRQSELTDTAIQAKNQALEDSVLRGNSIDDIKSAAGSIQVALRQLLRLTQLGSNADAFLFEYMAPLVTDETQVYTALRSDVFGDNVA